MRIISSMLAIICFSQFVFAGQANFEWETVSAESEGMSSEKLDAAKDTLAAKGTKTLLVIRNDKIVYEWYASGWDSKRRHYTASLAKALVGGVSLMLALNDGRLSVDDPACNYIPEWKADPQRSKITIRHLATHSSGVEDAEQGEIPHFELPGWKGGFWKKDPDPFTLSRDKAPIIFPPGTKYAYSNPGMAMLSYAVTASLQGTEHTDVRTLLRERVMRPIGVKDDEWSIGYGQTYKVNGLNLVANWGGGSYTARAVARVGRLMLRKGNWQGEQLIDSRFVEEVVKYAGTPLPDRPAGNPNPGSGLGWWTNFDGVWDKVPRDAFAGAGAGNQVLLVVPSLKLIIVRNGSNLFDSAKEEGFWGGLEKYLFNPVMEAIIDTPYPRSGLITKVNFAPASSIIRKAKGSDNWPITWADDDNLYTAYGDGWGFEPKTKKKLSLGIAKIVGSPPDFRGVNIRTDSGERIGQGAKGAKVSGMLCVDGVLYMLVRNTANSQIAWSRDHGKNWEWCDWKFTTSFGAPTFLNFGRNYASARDNFVYIYSHDSDSAYEPADRMVMARVHKEQIRNRDAYEFFKELDDSGKPIWTKNIHGRGAVFINPGRCYRSGISYNAGLKRYLWCQTTYGEDDMRFKGGIGIFDASVPWGPWTTVFYTENWDVGPGETSCLPTKWMSEDGKTCYLLFSGDDCFSVRKIQLLGRNTVSHK
ncbi:MAG TPA: serine hydrolase [Sedimentisphaerales bacterium]|nr:serine hydrolase [Sedimentisphaerales bacterium]